MGEEPIGRIEADLSAALRRKPAYEARLAGALRALSPHSVRLRTALLGAVETLVRRKTHDRPLYAASVRALAETGDRRSTPVLRRALADDDAGGLSTLSAACFATDPALADSLARVAASRHPHLAFAAEVARVARGESGGEHVASLAPKIKESHRIASSCTQTTRPVRCGALASSPIESSYSRPSSTASSTITRTPPRLTFSVHPSICLPPARSAILSDASRRAPPPPRRCPCWSGLGNGADGV